EVLLPLLDRYRRRGQRSWSGRTPRSRCRTLYEALERRGVRYAIRLPANDVLERRIEDLLTRPRGRPSHAPLVRYRSFEYQAASWSRPRRVIAKVEHHLGELFPRVGFIVTTLTGTNRAVVRFYNQRGTAEQWIKEGKEATHWTRLSCHRFRANEVRLLLGVIAYNLGNLLLGWFCRSPSRVGPSRVCNSGCSRPVADSFGTPGTSSSNWPKVTGRKSHWPKVT